MAYDYKKLKGRIVEKGYTQAGFAKEVGMAESTLSQKLHGKSLFNQDEIMAAKKVLGLKTVDPYFFEEELRKFEV